MSEATEARQDAYDAIDELGLEMTFVHKAYTNNTTQSSASVVETEHTVKGSPPQELTQWDSGTLIQTGLTEVVLPALSLGFVPDEGMDVQVGSAEYMVDQVVANRLQDLVIAYQVRMRRVS